MRRVLALLLVPALAVAGDWYTDNTPTPTKTGKTLPVGADPTRYIRAEDWNDYVKVPTELLRTESKAHGVALADHESRITAGESLNAAQSADIAGLALGTPSASSALVTSTGGTTARALRDRFADTWIVTDFGAACDATSASAGTDDTAAIQAALNKARDSRIKKVRVPASTRISAPLVIYSGVWLDVDPAATVYWSSSVGGDNLIVNRAVNTVQRSVTDAAITAGATTLTSATAAFTSADVGRTVTVAGAGPGGGAPNSATVNPLSANIETVTNATTVTLSRAAKVTVTGATAKVYDRDTNITITGGTWARGGALGGVLGLHSLRFRRLDGLTIRNVKVTSSAGKYSIWLGDVTDAHLQRIRFDASSDGIHMNGPVSRIAIRDVSGTTGDDMVAITGVDYDDFADVGGDVSDVLVDGVMGTGNMAGFKLITGTNSVARNVTVRNFYAKFPYGFAIGDDNTGPTDIDNMVIENAILDYDSAGIASGPTYGRNLTIRNIAFATGGGPGPLIDLGNWESVVIDGVTRPEGISGNPTLLTTRAGSDIRSLVVSRVQSKLGPAASSANTAFVVNGTVHVLRLDSLSFTVNNAITNNPILSVASGATVDNISISGLTGVYYSGTSASFSSSGIVSVAGTVGVLTANSLRFDLGSDTTNTNVLRVGGTLYRFSISDLHVTKGRGLLDTGAGSTVGPGMFSNVSAVGSNRLANVASPVDLTFSNLTADSLLNPAIYTNGGAVTVRGSGVNRVTAWSGFTRGAGTEALRVINPDWPADLSTLTKADGDAAYNTNAGLACGAGRAISNGTNWKNVFSGLTY